MAVAAAAAVLHTPPTTPVVMQHQLLLDTMAERSSTTQDSCASSLRSSSASASSAGPRSSPQRVGEEVMAARVRASVLRILENVAKANQSFGREHRQGNPKASFDCECVPSVTLTDYGENLSQLSRSRTVWLLTLTYLNRVSAIGEVVLCDINAHRLLLVAMLLALKMASPDGAPQRIMRRVAAAGGVGTEDLCEMEVQFIRLVDWRLRWERRELTTVGEVLTRLEEVATAAAMDAQKGGALNPLLPIPACRSVSLTPRSPAVALRTPRGASSAFAGRHRHASAQSPASDAHPLHTPLHPRPPTGPRAPGPWSPHSPTTKGTASALLPSDFVYDTMGLSLYPREDSADPGGLVCTVRRTPFSHSARSSGTGSTGSSVRSSTRCVTFAPGV
eukprot:TRINITY_DN1823_c0_g1_i1.p1 TRINITY_DN1823_c0_g1~~TRINITY_DN1823_c0_g1_i1.p1  ORF type:complete len:420 (+),score=82.12 TRINITY_DN1823_c0_g1_i1:92-1261(+)